MFDAYNCIRTISLILTCFYQVIKEWDKHEENIISFTKILTLILLLPTIRNTYADVDCRLIECRIHRQIIYYYCCNLNFKHFILFSLQGFRK